MARLSEDVVAAVRERTAIKDVVEEHVTLRRSGATGYKGLCPFHDEKTPSFTVNTATNTWHCFGCSEGGDVISFHQRITHGDFRSTVEYLASRSGITLTYDDATAAEDDVYRVRGRIFAALGVAHALFVEHLISSPDAQTARDELARRGFDPADSASRFGCGYAPRDARTLKDALTAKGLTVDDGVAAGLIHDRSKRPVFMGRLTWAITDSQSRPAGFGARRIYPDDPLQAKFINTAETPVFKKSHLLYGLTAARRTIGTQRHAIVVEGYTDVMAAHLAGATNTVATCGTAITRDHLTALHSIVGDGGEITFAMDDDPAGHKAILAAYAMAAPLIPRLTALPTTGGRDPDEVRQSGGDQAVQRLIAARRPLLASVIDATIDPLPLTSAEDRRAALSAVAPLLSRVNDTLLREDYAAQVAARLGYTLGQVLSTANSAGTSTTAPDPEDPTGPSPAVLTLPWPVAELLRVLVQDEATAVHLRHSLPTLPLPNPARPALGAVLGGLAAEPLHPWTHRVMSAAGENSGDVAALATMNIAAAPDQFIGHAEALIGQLQADAAAAERAQLLASLPSLSPEARRDALERLDSLQSQA